MRKHGYIEGIDRDQHQLLPLCIEDYIDEGSAVRFIDAFVKSLDMEKLGFSHHTPQQTGAPSYDPRDLLALYLYGYVWSITSTRRLEAEAKRNVELMWLLKGLHPDHNSISRFRQENVARFKGVLRAFNAACRELKLFSKQVAIDGAKFKANNGRDTYMKRSTRKEDEAKAAARVEKYLAALEAADASTDDTPSGDQLSKQELESKLAYWQSKQEKAQAELTQLDEAGVDELALTDEDSRWMWDNRQNNGKPRYNVQTAVDTESHLIVAIDAVQDKNDLHQLGSMANKAREELEIAPDQAEKEKQLTVLADTGYHEADELAQCEQNNITAIVPASATGSGKVSKGEKKGQDIYPKEAFNYDKEDDSYSCPGGATLAHHGTSKADGKVLHLYSNEGACGKCALKELCTTAKYRRITRRDSQESVERAAQVFEENKESFGKRKSSVEHVFATLRNRKQDEFRLRGRENVLGELHLSALAYNITRVINILGIGVLLEWFKRRKLAPIG